MCIIIKFSFKKSYIFKGRFEVKYCLVGSSDMQFSASLVKILLCLLNKLFNLYIYSCMFGFSKLHLLLFLASHMVYIKRVPQGWKSKRSIMFYANPYGGENKLRLYSIRFFSWNQYSKNTKAECFQTTR